MTLKRFPLRRILNLAYTYDAAGNLAGRQNNTLLQAFQTDKANELVNVALANNLLTVAGSLANGVSALSVNGQSASIYSDLTFSVPGGVTVTNGANTLTAVINGTLTNSLTEVLPAAVNLRYDANGNLLWDGVKAFTYDCANELAGVTVTNVIKTTYAYDGLGRRRIRRDYSWTNNAWAETNEVHYVYDGMTVLQERNSNNVPVVTYTRGVDLSGTVGGGGGIGGLLARTDANGSTYYHADGNGNITALVDGSGNLVAKYLYDSFGNTLGMWGSLAAANTDRFSSKEMDLRTGIYYFGYRYYEPNLQRWLNRDPIQERGGINLYDYVNNDPINLFDPLGLWNADRQEELDSRQPTKPNPGPSPGMTCSLRGLLDMPAATARAVASQFALGVTAAGSLYNTWNHNVDNLPHDPNAVYYVPMGFGFGTVSYYDSSDESVVNLPAMMMGDTPILLTPSELDVFAQEAQSRIQRTGIPVGPGAPRRPLD